MTSGAVPEPLRVARRSLEEIDGVEVCDGWTWDERMDLWMLKVMLRPGTAPHSYVPAATGWYVGVDERYPLGRIIFLPSAADGLTTTFPHQHHNGVDAQGLCRLGVICLEDYLAVMGRGPAKAEPETAGTRLRWRASRALEWLRAASEDQLLPAGSPFELPEFPKTSNSPKVVFSEDRASFDAWARHEHRWGTVEVSRPPSVPAAIVLRRFLTPSGHPIWEPKWGSALSPQVERPERGIWIRLGRVPVDPPWQAPTTWGQLRRLTADGGVHLDEALHSALPRIRDGRPHLLLVGFPIPRTMGEPVQQLHWQAVQLPKLCDLHEVPNGFRRNAKGQWQADRTRIFANDHRIEWCASENWNTEEIATRGQFPKAVSRLSVVIIGAGALGSSVAELLVRAGVSELTILDSEEMEVGNLVRHTLLLGDVGRSKAEAVAARLNLAHPAARVRGFAEKFPLSDVDHESVRGADVVIETTASNDVVASMGAFPWRTPRRFFSLSLSLGARRLYLFSATEEAFPYARFRTAVDPLVAEDVASYDDEIPWEGIGCWHPVFPARSDDIWMLASAGVKQVVQILGSAPEGPQMMVLENVVEMKSFSVADAA